MLRIKCHTIATQLMIPAITSKLKESARAENTRIDKGQTVAIKPEVIPLALPRPPNQPAT